nr:substrate-binding domain-containing protein [Tessaracoccus sp. MC1865]
MRQGRTTTVGFLLRDISNPLFANIAKRCEHDLRQAGYSMIFMSSDGDAEVETSNLAVLRRRRVDGVIASLVTETAPDTVSALQQLTVPLVLVDREVEGVSAGAVLTDHYSGVLEAVRALLADGRRRIALVTGNLDVRSTRERTRAMMDAHTEAGIDLDTELLKFGAFDSDWGHRATGELLGMDRPPDAILGGGIGPALGALQVLRERGVSDAISIVALDEWPHFDVLTPGIASVRRDASMGEVIAAEMLRLLRSGEPEVSLLPTIFDGRGVLPKESR